MPTSLAFSSTHSVERYAAIGDTLDIICPFYDQNTPPEETEQSIIYRVTENEYELCQKHSSAKELGRCVAPYRMDKLKVSFRLMNPNPSGLDYKPGVTYYFISTSTGSKSGLENESGGLCASHNLKMVIHVTEKNGDIGHIHRHHHGKKPTTTPETASREENRPKTWPKNDPLWGEFYQKIVVPAENNPRPKYEHNRAERVTLDSGDSKDLYESIPIAEDRIDFQIHEIGEGDIFYL
ncbi:hypothetical protein WR25_03045 [Diploscapter pachys]|uniref:Ephrin RBD domain-containing protein n=1 Tax=Diploscapter pachys TaxID=2018661 RepID=A0A2A2K8K4_9BILA|nr:hypothetical protein WR25_03045 [Diploscapter pachys]